MANPIEVFPEESYRTLSIDWMEDAACQPQNGAAIYDERDLFHGGREDQFGGFKPDVDLLTAAKEVCKRCIVRNQCLQYAYDTDQQLGVWGGYTPRERKTNVLKLNKRLQRG